MFPTTRVATRLSRTLALSLALAGCGGGGGGGGGEPSASNPAKGIYVGVLTGAGGAPVAGARVSIDGIEARRLTGTDGRYVVSDPDLATGGTPRRARAGGGGGGGGGSGAVPAAGAAAHEIAVLAPGYEPYVASLEVFEGELANVDLVRIGLAPSLTLAVPAGEPAFVVPAAGCGSPAVKVEGVAALGALPGFRLDLVLVIDRSGSTSRPAFDVDGDGEADSVLEAEIAAARCFVAGLDLRATRVAVVSFNDEAHLATGFTSDAGEIDAALGSLGGSSGGTNFEAAFLAARDAIVTLETADRLAEQAEGLPEENATPAPSPLRAVIFLSDGVPTSHGVPRDKSDSNLTQSSADRRAAIAAAAALGADTRFDGEWGAQLFAFSVIPANDTNRPRTTLPHCVAACGGGRYENLQSPALLR